MEAAVPPTAPTPPPSYPPPEQAIPAPPPKPAVIYRPLGDSDKELLKYLYLITVVVLILDLFLNRYISIILIALPLMSPYLASVLLYAISLYWIVNNRPVTRSFKAILIAAPILGAIGTLIPYILGLTTGTLAYSPIWLVNLIILYKVYSLSKAY
jgi:hypothetical protein